MNNAMKNDDFCSEREKLTASIAELQQKKSELKRKNSRLFKQLCDLIGCLEKGEENTNA